MAASLPVNRTEFKEYILRRLGFPTIEINIDDEQIEDRINDALAYYQEYHFDGSEKIFLKHLITDQNKTDKYITIPENIIGITRVLTPGSVVSGGSMFNVQYQMALNDMFNLSSKSLIPYYQTMMHWELYSNIFSKEPGILFNRKTDKLYVHHDWSQQVTGQYLVIECYSSLDPNTYTEIWSDRWLLRYATAIVKRQWGEHLTKFGGVQMLGGITFDGTGVLQQALQEIEKLEGEMMSSYAVPVLDFIG